MKSILTDNFKECLLCKNRIWIEEHHVFGASNRKKSTKYKLIAPLCHYCHNEPKTGVHHNRKKSDELKRRGQEAFEEHYPNLNFREVFGKNYL